MRSQAIRLVAAIVSVLLLTALPAHADQIPFSSVAQTFGSLQSGGQTQELRLTTVSQNGSTPASGSTSQQQGGDTKAAAPSTLISTGAQQGGQQSNVEVVEEGDVTGTVCDCGEIKIPAGFKFPWFALAGVPPLICATGACTNHNPPCTGNCGEIPEPATLLLLGSGLAALGARARRRKSSKQDNEVSTDTEV